MELLNNIQGEILEHLGRFGFLAVSQFRMLTGKSVGYLREMLGSLSRRGYIKSYRVEVTHKVRAENIYYLTGLGKEFLLAHKNVFADDIKLPVGTPLVVRDYFHRYHFVSVHISIYHYLKAYHIPLSFFLTYFDKTGSVKKGNLTAKTRIPLEGQGFFIPDGIFKTDSSLYLLEMYCDKDTKRILNSLAAHARAIALGTPAMSFGMGKTNPYVLAVFAHDGIRQAVIKRLQHNENFTPMSKLFFFASLEDVQKDCGNAWQTINGERLMFL